MVLGPQHISLILPLPNSKEGVLSKHDLLTKLMVWAEFWGLSQLRRTFKM